MTLSPNLQLRKCQQRKRKLRRHVTCGQLRCAKCHPCPSDELMQRYDIHAKGEAKGWTTVGAISCVRSPCLCKKILGLGPLSDHPTGVVSIFKCHRFVGFCFCLLFLSCSLQLFRCLQQHLSLQISSIQPLGYLTRCRQPLPRAAEALRSSPIAGL